MYKLLIAFVISLTFGFNLPIAETHYIGTIKTTPKNKDLVIHLNIEFRIDTMVIAQSRILKDGRFKISTSTKSEFDVYYLGIGVPETYLQTVKPNSNETKYLNFKIPKIYKKHFGKSICPKCLKYDLTIPIHYGFGNNVIIQKIDNNGDTSLSSSSSKNYFDGGCVNSEIAPKYYCKRDRIKY